MAGGLGRAFGVDPVLGPVAFVDADHLRLRPDPLRPGLAALPADGTGRRSSTARPRSHTAPVLAVGLAIVALIAIMSMFSWGLPSGRRVIAGVVVVLIARTGSPRSATARARPPDRPGMGDQWSAKAAEADRRAQARQWVAGNPGRKRRPTSSQPTTMRFSSRPRSPPSSSSRHSGRADGRRARTRPGERLREDAGPQPHRPRRRADPSGRSLGPAVLGPWASSFAWDRPSRPHHAPRRQDERDRSDHPGRRPAGRHGRRSAACRSWWALSWAMAAGMTIVAIDLLASCVARSRST